MTRDQITPRHDLLAMCGLFAFGVSLWTLIRSVDWYANLVGTWGVVATLGIVVCLVLRRLT